MVSELVFPTVSGSLTTNTSVAIKDASERKIGCSAGV